MRLLSVFMLPVLCCVGYAEEPVKQPQTPTEMSDRSEQIKFLTNEISKYEGLALEFDRKAQRMQSRDFTEYRRALTLREQCKDIAGDLKKKLADIEQKGS